MSLTFTNNPKVNLLSYIESKLNISLLGIIWNWGCCSSVYIAILMPMHVGWHIKRIYYYYIYIEHLYESENIKDNDGYN